MNDPEREHLKEPKPMAASAPSDGPAAVAAAAMASVAAALEEPAPEKAAATKKPAGEYMGTATAWIKVGLFNSLMMLNSSNYCY